MVLEWIRRMWDTNRVSVYGGAYAAASAGTTVVYAVLTGGEPYGTLTGLGTTVAIGCITKPFHDLNEGFQEIFCENMRRRLEDETVDDLLST